MDLTRAFDIGLIVGMIIGIGIGAGLGALIVLVL